VGLLLRNNEDVEDVDEAETVTEAVVVVAASTTLLTSLIEIKRTPEATTINNSDAEILARRDNNNNIGLCLLLVVTILLVCDKNSVVRPSVRPSLMRLFFSEIQNDKAEMASLPSAFLYWFFFVSDVSSCLVSFWTKVVVVTVVSLVIVISKGYIFENE